MGWLTKALLFFVLAAVTLHLSQAALCSRNNVQFKCKCISKQRVVARFKRRIREIQTLTSRQNLRLRAIQHLIKSTRREFIKIPRTVSNYLASLKRQRNNLRWGIIHLQRKRQHCRRLKRLIGSQKALYKRVNKMKIRYAKGIQHFFAKLKRIKKVYVDSRLQRTPRCNKHLRFLKRRRRKWGRSLRRFQRRYKGTIKLLIRIIRNKHKRKALYKRDCSRNFHQLLRKHRKNYRAKVRLLAKKLKQFRRRRRRNRRLRRRIRRLRARRFRIIASKRHNAFKSLVFKRGLCIYDNRNKSKACQKIRKRFLKRAYKHWKKGQRKARKATRSVYRTIHIKQRQLKIIRRQFNHCKKRRFWWRRKRCIRLRRRLRRLSRRIQHHLRRRRRRAYRRFYRVRALYRFCRRIVHRKKHYKKRCRNIYKRFVSIWRIIRRYRRQSRRRFYRRYRQIMRRYHRCLKYHRRRPRRCLRQKRAYFHWRTILQNQRRQARYRRNKRYYRRVRRTYIRCKRRHLRHYWRFCGKYRRIVNHLWKYFFVHYVVTLKKAKAHLIRVSKRSRRCRGKYHRRCKALRLKVMEATKNVRLWTQIVMSMTYRSKLSRLRKCRGKNTKWCRKLRFQVRRLRLHLKRGRRLLYHMRKALYHIYMRLFKRCAKRHRRRIYRCKGYLRRALHLQRHLRAQSRFKRRNFASQIKRKRILYRRVKSSHDKCKRSGGGRRCKALRRRARLIARQLVRLIYQQFKSRLRLLRVVKGRLHRLCRGPRKHHHRRTCSRLRRRRRSVIQYLVRRMRFLPGRDHYLYFKIVRLYQLCKKSKGKCRFLERSYLTARKPFTDYNRRKLFNRRLSKFINCGKKHGKLSKKCSRKRSAAIRLLIFFLERRQRKFRKRLRQHRSARRRFRRCAKHHGGRSKTCRHFLHKLLVARLHVISHERRAAVGH